MRHHNSEGALKELRLFAQKNSLARFYMICMEIIRVEENACFCTVCDIIKGESTTTTAKCCIILFRI
jgi:hypothetical protein